MDKFKGLKKGEVLSETQYYVVEEIKGNKVQLKNDIGENVVVDGDYVNKLLTSANQYTTEKKVSRTEIANLFINNPLIAMTVNYNKQLDVNDVIDDLVRSTSKTEIKNLLKGEERTMIGRHFGELTDLGRIQFVDMQVERDKSKGYDNRLRQVDPRTINYLILKGTKYTVK